MRSKHARLKLSIQDKNKPKKEKNPQSELVDLLQKPRWHFRPPNRQTLIPRRSISNRRLVIQQIAIRIVFDHVSRCVPPVIENLGAQDMSSHTPYTLVSLFGQPLVTQLLGIKVMHLERAVMHVRSGIGAYEETVMVNKLGASIDMRKHGHINSLRVFLYVQEI